MAKGFFPKLKWKFCPAKKKQIHVYLNSNQIRAISNCSFDSLSNLKYLNLGFNNFSVKTFLLSTFDNLEELILDSVYEIDKYEYSYYNEILEFSINAKGYFPKLKKLSLKSSRINYIKFKKNNFPSLTHLLLQDNEFKNNLMDDNLKQLPNSLKYLNLDYNIISSLSLKTLPNLIWLSLNNQKVIIKKNL